MDLQSGNWKSHLTNLAAFPSTVALRIWWTRGKQWTFILTLVRPSTLSLHPHRQMDEVQRR